MQIASFMSIGTTGNEESLMHGSNQICIDTEVVKRLINVNILCIILVLYHMDLSGATYVYITRYGGTLYIGIAMVVPILQYIRKCQFLYTFQVNLTFSIFA